LFGFLQPLHQLPPSLSLDNQVSLEFVNGFQLRPEESKFFRLFLTAGMSLFQQRFKNLHLFSSAAVGFGSGADWDIGGLPFSRSRPSRITSVFNENGAGFGLADDRPPAEGRFASWGLCAQSPFDSEPNSTSNE
jgi:hypothetical protein